MSRLLCIFAALLALVACLVLPADAQAAPVCSDESYTTQFVRVTSTTAFSPQPVLQCNSTSYAVGAVMYVNESVSTGLLSYTLFFNNNKSSTSASFTEPVVNGSVVACDWATFQGVVGETFPTVISCGVYGSSWKGECNVRYNFSLICAQASPFQLPPTASSPSLSGDNAAALTASAGASWLALMLVSLFVAQ